MFAFLLKQMLFNVSMKYIYAIKRPRRLFKTWPGWPGVCLKLAFNRVPAFINGVQFPVLFQVKILLSISSSRPTVPRPTRMLISLITKAEM